MLSLVVLLAAGSATGAPAQPVRMSLALGDVRLVAEVRDLPAAAAESALRRSLETAEEMSRIAQLDGETAAGVAAVNRAAGQGASPVNPRLLRLLARAQEFCLFTEGAHGPLGARLYELWGLRQRRPGLPTAPELDAARESARCDRLALDPAASTVRLAAGSRIDLWLYSSGFAVDEAVAVLRGAGAANGYVELGGVRRGFGAGPSGRGWPVTIPAFGDAAGGQTIHLRDQAVALVTDHDRRLRAGGEEHSPYLDQRSGRPVSDVVAVAAIAQQAVDAEGLAGAMFVLGNRVGHFKLGSLRPPPSVLWVLGAGDGPPLFAGYRWGRGKI